MQNLLRKVGKLYIHFVDLRTSFQNHYNMSKLTFKLSFKILKIEKNRVFGNFRTGILRFFYRQVMISYSDSESPFRDLQNKYTDDLIFTSTTSKIKDVEVIDLVVSAR